LLRDALNDVLGLEDVTLYALEVGGVIELQFDIFRLAGRRKLEGMLEVKLDVKRGCLVVYPNNLPLITQKLFI